MLLTQPASSPPNFILIGASLVWQTLPAGWVHLFESHYTSHMLGNCTYPIMKVMFIERHNIAARMILKLLLEGSHDKYYVLADVALQPALGTWARWMPGCQICSHPIQNWCARDSVARHCYRTSSSLLLSPPHLHNKTCTCTSQDLCAAPLENNIGCGGGMLCSNLNITGEAATT